MKRVKTMTLVHASYLTWILLTGTFTPIESTIHVHFISLCILLGIEPMILDLLQIALFEELYNGNKGFQFNDCNLQCAPSGMQVIHDLCSKTVALISAVSVLGAAQIWTTVLVSGWANLYFSLPPELILYHVSHLVSVYLTNTPCNQLKLAGSLSP